MCSGRFFREIGGTVSCDVRQEDGSSGSDPLSGVIIRLYLISDHEIRNSPGADTEIFRQMLAAETKTDDKGGYRFPVIPGTYCLSLDVESLPVGKGVKEACRTVHPGDTGSFDFSVKEVASLRISVERLQLNIGEELAISTVARDADGNILSARLNYSTESDEIDLYRQHCRSKPKLFRAYSTSITIDAGHVRKIIPVSVRIPRISSAERVKLASKLGLLDVHERTRHLSDALFHSGRLPDEYRSRHPIKSGTGILEELKRYMESRSADTAVKDAVRQSVSSSVPELDMAYRSPGGYFNVHYTLSGSNAVDWNIREPKAVPPYVRQIGEAFDNVRVFTCLARGFREPPLKSGTSAYDVYVYDLKGTYGITYSSEIQENRNSGVRTASSYICIDNSYSREKGFDKSRLDCMRVTAAHEFFHAVQYAYNVDADQWWKEASATWNEDEVYTGVNDYVRYIRKYFDAPYRPLDETSYSGVVFVKFLSENYGGYEAVRRIWEVETAGSGNSIHAIDRYLRSRYNGKDIGSVFDQFSAYNINPAQYYKEGASWELSAAPQNTYARYPVAMNLGQLDHLASNYQLFKPVGSETGKSLKITVEGSEDFRGGFKLQKRDIRTKLYTMTEILSRGKYDRAEVDLNGFGTSYDEVWLIPANLEKERNGMPYIYHADMK